jgi:hypothetical protein
MKIAQNQMEVASQMIAVRSMPDVKQRAPSRIAPDGDRRHRHRDIKSLRIEKLPILDRTRIPFAWAGECLAIRDLRTVG